MSSGTDKTIIIKSNHKSIFDGLKNVYSYCFSYSLFIRAFRKITKKMHISVFEPFFYGSWKKVLKQCNLVILFDNDIFYINTVSKYIKKKNPDVKIVFWYWNPVALFGGKIVDSKYIDEVWTYDRFDAKKYHLKYNPQFYRLVNVPKSDCSGADLVFLGRDKGRKELLDKIREIVEPAGFKCDFKIIGHGDSQMPYDDYLKRIESSNCVVDLVPEQLCGMTLRPLEALFLEKKLITNYKDIINYKFYNPANIFIIGHDDIKKLADFIKKPYKKIDKKTIDYYSYNEWLKRIEHNESVNYE